MKPKMRIVMKMMKKMRMKTKMKIPAMMKIVLRRLNESREMKRWYKLIYKR